jgi:uncharacterized protein YqgC (DUF456 family)
MDTFSTVLLIVAVVTVIIGVAGLILPVIPGPLVIFGGLVLAAWAEEFQYISGTTIIILAILALLAFGVDYVAGALGARRVGASKPATLGALIGAFIGIFFGFIGIILGPFIGAVIGQLTVKRDLNEAGQVGIATWLGMVFGLGFKVAVGFFMIGYYLLVRFI